MSAADVHLSTEVAAGSESAPAVDVNATEITIDGSGVPQQRNEWDDSPKGLHNDPNVTPMFAPIRTDSAFVEEQRGRMRSHEQTEDRKATNQYWEGKRHWDPRTFFPVRPQMYSTSVWVTHWISALLSCSSDLTSRHRTLFPL